MHEFLWFNWLIMAGYGVPYVLELIYSEHTVPHVLSGKAFARAI